MQNPLTVDYKGKHFRDESYRSVIDRARAEGRDGVIIKNTYDSGERSKLQAVAAGRLRPETIYVAFNPEQIKATDNRGSFSPASPKVRESIPMPKSISELSDAVKGLAEDARSKALGLLPLNTLTDWAAKNQVAVGQYVELKRAMDTFRNKKHAAADEIIQQWRKVIGKGGKNAQAVADVMHESTLAGIDPSLTDSETTG
jgi:hypothetical protein